MHKEETEWPSAGHAWYVTGLLTIAYIVSFLDRQILSLLIPAIKADMQLTDGELGLLGGVAFALFYTMLGVPIGYLADRFSRRNLIAAGIAFWCMMTAACGLARSFPQLFMARIGVGVGEATLNPAALSMISDLFPKSRISLPMSIFNLGVWLGTGASFALGGYVVATVLSAGDLTVPVLGPIKGWQAVFLAVGLPGLLVSLAMFTYREPARKGLAVMDGERLPWNAVIHWLKSRKKSALAFCLGISVVSINGYMFFLWIPSLFIREHGWTTAEIGYSYGAIVGIGGLIGAISGGAIAGRLIRGGNPGGALAVVRVAAVGIVITAVAAGLMPSPTLILATTFVMFICNGAATACGPAALVPFVPNQLRAQVVAVYYFSLNAFGAIGPFTVGALNDRIGDLGLSLSINAGILCGTACLVLLYASRHMSELFRER